MKFFTELVLAALAVTTANADNLRSPQSEGNEDDFGYGAKSVTNQKYAADEDVDEPFMVDLTTLYGPHIPKKVDILELLGDKKGQVPVDDVREYIEAWFPSPEKNPQGPNTDITNIVNVKGNNAITDINNNANVKENTAFTKDDDQLTNFDDTEYEKGEGLTTKIGNNVNVKSGNYGHVQFTKVDDTVNVKGGKGGVLVEEDSELDFDESDESSNNDNKKGGLTTGGAPSATKMVKESGTSPHQITTLYEGGAGGIVNDGDEDDDNDNKKTRDW